MSDFRIQIEHDGKGALRYCTGEDVGRVLIQVFRQFPGADVRVTLANHDPAEAQR